MLKLHECPPIYTSSTEILDIITPGLLLILGVVNTLGNHMEKMFKAILIVG